MFSALEIFTRRIGPAIFVVFALGCGNSLPPKADPTLARESLKAALQAWQQGEDVATTLPGRNPPVHFTDLDQKAGKRLQSYKIADGHDTYGQSLRIAALLSLKGTDGGAREKKAEYLIDTGAAVVITPAGP